MRRSGAASVIGKMLHKIEIQDRDLTPGRTDHSEEFTTEATTQAEIKTLKRGIEVWDGNNLVGTGSHHFFIRHREGLTSDKWVLFDGRRFQILRVEFVNERRRFQKLLCVERGSAEFAITSQ